MIKILLTSTLLGAILLIASVIFICFPPKEINSLYGYRTSASMKNQKTWNEANRYSSKLMLITSIVSILAGIAFTYIFKNEKAILISIAFSLLLLIATIPATEIHLKKKFGNHSEEK